MRSTHNGKNHESNKIRLKPRRRPVTPSNCHNTKGWNNFARAGMDNAMSCMQRKRDRTGYEDAESESSGSKRSLSGCDESTGERKQEKAVVQPHIHTHTQHLRKLDHLRRKQQSQWDRSSSGPLRGQATHRTFRCSRLAVRQTKNCYPVLTQWKNGGYKLQ
jgi:hypothetical protein